MALMRNKLLSPIILLRGFSERDCGFPQNNQSNCDFYSWFTT